jgi:hypothetical protein
VILKSSGSQTNLPEPDPDSDLPEMPTQEVKRSSLPNLSINRSIYQNGQVIFKKTNKYRYNSQENIRNSDAGVIFKNTNEMH